jgi:hypothetical protein
MEYRAETQSELLVRIRVIIILAEIPRETLNAVFSNGWKDGRMDGAIVKLRADRWWVCRMS